MSIIRTSLFHTFEEPGFATWRTLNTAACTTPYPGEWQLPTTCAGVPSAKWIRVYETGNQSVMTMYILTVTVAQVQRHKRWCMWEVVKHVPARHEACLLSTVSVPFVSGLSAYLCWCVRLIYWLSIKSEPDLPHFKSLQRETHVSYKLTHPILFALQGFLFQSLLLLMIYTWYFKYVFRECLLTFKSHGEIGALSPVVKETTPGSYCRSKNELHNRHLEKTSGFPDLTMSTAQLSSQCSLRRKSGE